MKIYTSSFVLLIFVLTGCQENSQFKSIENQQLKLSNTLIYLAQFSDDLAEVALVDENRHVTIWNLERSEKTFHLPAEETPNDIRQFLYKKKSNLLIIASSNQLMLWNINSQNLIGKLNVVSEEPLAKISSLAISNYGGIVAVGMTDGTLFLYNLNSHSSIIKRVHKSTISKIIFDRAGFYIMTSGHDGKVIKSKLENLEIDYEIKIKNRISSLAYDEMRDLFFVSDVLKNQMIYDFNTGKLKVDITYPARFRWFRNSLFLKSIPYILTTNSKINVSMWDIHTGKEVLTWNTKALSLGSTTLDIAENADKIATISSEGIFQSWSIVNN